MGYMHINNAYKVPDLFIFKELYALEKIHGTSAHLSFNAEKKPHQVHFFSGGATHETFVGLFDKKDLLAKFLELGHSQVTVHGEAYGGKLLRMKETYGPQLRFVAFDVKIGDHWLAVTSAHEIATKLGLEFVHYDRIPATIEAIDAVRDAPSIQAKRNGISEDRIREGVVLRPVIELTRNDGSRFIAKHKRSEFMETATPRDVNPEELKVLEEAEAIAQEWVTEMRLEHVLSALQATGLDTSTMKICGKLVDAMVEDVKRESQNETIWSREAERAVGSKAVTLFKKYLKKDDK